MFARNLIPTCVALMVAGASISSVSAERKLPFELPPAPAFPIKQDGDRRPLLAQLTGIEESEDGEFEPVPAPAAGIEAEPSRRYGQEPTPRRPPITFLRNQAVLLEQGEHQFDIGLVYSVDEFDFPVFAPPATVGEANITQRNMFVPLTWRYGITDQLQGLVAVPVGYGSTELSVPGADFHDNTGPIGDVVVSLSYALPKKCAYDPDLIWTNSLTIPTGEPSDLGVFPSATTGNGWFEYSSQMLAIQRYDPVIVFGGVGSRYAFKTERNGFDVERGLAFDYRLGVGFGVNEQVSLSAQFQGSFETELELDGVGLPGSDRDLMSLRFAITKAECDRVIEPFVTVGLTRDANDAQVGVIWTFR